MAEDADDFEIDIYGDSEEPEAPKADSTDTANAESNQLEAHDANGDVPHQETEASQANDQIQGTSDQLDSTTIHDNDTNQDYEGDGNQEDYLHMDNEYTEEPHQERETVADTSDVTKSHSNMNDTQAASNTTVPQGVKRKEAPGVDRHASSALFLSDLNWWNTEDDIRGWANANQCEDELKDITFSEHKVNGKSKGQAYVEFSSAQAASTVKKYLESSVIPEWSPSKQKLSVTFTSAATNPFRTLPKDAPTRNATSGRGGFNNNDRAGAYSSFGARGRGFGNRGGGFNQRGNFNQAGNFNQGGMGAGNFGMGGFQGNAMGGMNMGFNNRGGMMQMGGMRGGMGPRGGRGGGFGQMAMNGMMPNMTMAGAGFGGPMGMMAGYGAPAQGYMNPAFFGGGAGQQMGGGNNDWNNPHGAKRPRGE